jgi:hypothetical protein
VGLPSSLAVAAGASVAALAAAAGEEEEEDRHPAAEDLLLTFPPAIAAGSVAAEFASASASAPKTFRPFQGTCPGLRLRNSFLLGQNEATTSRKCRLAMQEIVTPTLNL